jgi:3D (Asp-Asp-Asp) domain-containing protein
MKSLFGGGAVFATALLTASVLFYAHPLAAEPAFQNPTKQQQKKESTTAATFNGTLETREASAAQAQPAETTALTPVNIADTDVDAQPLEDAQPLMASAALKSGGREATELVASAPPQTYTATAYNLGGRTASGKPVSKGIIAADPGVLPLGTRVRLEAGPYSGEYLVADTGGGVRGRKIDVWVPTTREACRFGRRSVKLTVLTYGGKRQKVKVRR